MVLKYNVLGTCFLFCFVLYMWCKQFSCVGDSDSVVVTIGILLVIVNVVSIAVAIHYVSCRSCVDSIVHYVFCVN